MHVARKCLFICGFPRAGVPGGVLPYGSALSLARMPVKTYHSAHFSLHFQGRRPLSPDIAPYGIVRHTTCSTNKEPVMNDEPLIYYYTLSTATGIAS
jgi:hypothetical protein